jgi:hypothetical protein
MWYAQAISFKPSNQKSFKHFISLKENPGDLEIELNYAKLCFGTKKLKKG